jgi:hypothetical protein
VTQLPKGVRRMAVVHVFAIDWIPAKDDIASGGGLRSLQIVEALRNAGHVVSYSVPGVCRHVRKLGRDNLLLRNVLIHDDKNQLDILRETRPEVVFWLPALGRNVPLTGIGNIVHVCDLIGLPHVEASLGAPGRVGPTRKRLVELCAGMDLMLTGSEEQHGYWLAQLTHDGGEPATAIVPYALPESMQTAGSVRVARLTKLHLTGMIYPWSTSVPLLQRAAAWVAKRDDVTLSAIVGTEPGGVTDRSVMRVLHEVAATRNVAMPGEVSFGRAMAEYKPGSVALDLYDPGLERRLAVPVRTVNALAHGVPILTTVESTLTSRLQAAGAVVIAADADGKSLEAALDNFAAMPPKELARMSRAARGFAAAEYNAGAAARVLTTALDRALQRRAERRRRWYARMPAADRLGHVLVVSDVGSNLRELRVDIPFGALHGRGLIAGYSVWSGEEFTFSTAAEPSRQEFRAIWVQREIPPVAAMALMALARPFVYDIDDNLLISPSYRLPFTIERQQTTRNLIWSCRVLSCSTARLAQSLQEPAIDQLAGKTVVTPSLLRDQPGPRPQGMPRFLVWASSDTPALTNSYLQMCKAVRDFCLSEELGLVCIGASPPGLLAESDVDIQHVASVPYGSYLSLLRSFAPAILVCPLETDGDPATQAFVDSKSDVKILEALASGLVGVFSRAVPYQDSELPGAVLCQNSYAGWFEGLREARRQCQCDTAPLQVPDERCASMLGLLPWFDALGRASLAEPLSAAAFNDALRLLRTRYGRRLLSELEFDARFYARQYLDVQQAIGQGVVPSAFAHYEADGFREGRQGRRGDVAEPHNEQVWVNLLHTLGDLRHMIDLRAQELELLKARRATRLKLRQSRR